MTMSEIQAAPNLGKQVEQFLGGYLVDGDPAIRYAVVRPEGERIVATVYECLEPPRHNFYDVVEFQNVEPDTDSEGFYFDSLEVALSFLQYRNGASADRFVNQGMVCEEYKDYRKAKNS